MIKWEESKNEALERLRHDYPNREFWYVLMHPSGTMWCTRPKGEPCADLHAYSPDELDDDLQLHLTSS